MNNIAKAIVIGAVAICATVAMAAIPSTISKFVPETMNYQGYLANPSTGEKYVDGIYDIECRLYRQASGGTAIWGAKYSVYVKDGYFNIMLGDDSSVAVSSTVSGSGTTTYGKSELMKALWYYNTSYPNLWLGVTPLQSATHANLASKSEISPRQQLLTAPYAFRAQSAEYANQSEGNFKVNGTLSVTGSFSLPSSFSLGNNINVGSSVVRFGGAASTDTASSSSNPNVNTYADYIYNRAYRDVVTSSSQGNLKFSTPSSKSFLFSDGSFAVTNTAVGSRIGLSSRNITLDGTYDGVTIKGYPPAKITTDGDVVITGASTRVSATSYGYLQAGSSVYVKSNSGNLYLQPATNNYVAGQGGFYWKPAGSTAYERPFKVIKVTVSVPSGYSSGTYKISTSYSPTQWSAMVVGYDASLAIEPVPRSVYVSKYSSSQYQVVIEMPRNMSSNQEFEVHVLLIQSTFCIESRW